MKDAKSEAEWTAHGWDTVECLIATNAGEPMKPLDEIASGGEMSRVMLALKVTVEEAAGARKKKTVLPRTLVFDEIDIGIGGRAAEAVGRKLKALSRGVTTLRRAAGLGGADRSAYDQFMLRFHHFMKESSDFQRNCRKERWEFPPGSTWICFTDTTSHSCISGQYALEQTFIIHPEALVAPERSPLAILESLCGRPLAA